MTRYVRFVLSVVSEFQVITDFDRTLTKARSLGKSVPSTHGNIFFWNCRTFRSDLTFKKRFHVSGILEHYPDFTSDTRQKVIMGIWGLKCDNFCSFFIFSSDAFQFLNLRDHYLPIEFDPNLSDEQKVPYMEEWWNQSHGELIRSGVKRHLLSETVASANVVLRDGAPDFLAKTHQLSVPVLIFSAGIGNVIEEILQRFECCFDNIQVASNYMNFNKQVTPSDRLQCLIFTEFVLFFLILVLASCKTNTGKVHKGSSIGHTAHTCVICANAPCLTSFESNFLTSARGFVSDSGDCFKAAIFSGHAKRKEMCRKSRNTSFV